MKLFHELKKGRLAGHPIHVMLIHFPMGLLPVSLLFDLLYYKTQYVSYSEMGFYCMLAGIAGGYIASIFGIIDLLQIETKSEAFTKALVHAGINFPVIICYTVIAALRWKSVTYAPAPFILYIFLNAGLNALLILGAYYGGDLIYRYKVGIKE